MSLLPTRRWVAAAALMLSALLSSSGCTSVREYVHNGFKVGPNYVPPAAPVAEHWIDAADRRVRSQQDDLAAWWTVFNDPVLNRLMVSAYQQNLTLRQAGFRVVQARADLAITRGTLFPQSQRMTGSYTRRGAGDVFSDQWALGFNLAWELDFWGRFRRAVIAAEDTLDASVEGYDDVLVTLLADVALNYVQVRIDQERITRLRETLAVQQDVLNVVNQKLQVGQMVTDVDQGQTELSVKQSLAQIASLELDLRQASNRLCTLLGVPATDLSAVLGEGRIPVAPVEIAVGMPADLVRRRPDVRRAERLAAAQAELIGIAEAELYPAISVTGSLGWQAAKASDLFKSQSFVGNVGPSFAWNILNYGRIVNNVRFQNARFQELVLLYQDTVLLADEEVENGIATFLKSEERRRYLFEGVLASRRALRAGLEQYGVGTAGFDYNRYATIIQNVIVQQEAEAQARGQVAQGLIQIYRALGGGWQIRLQQPQGAVAPAGPVQVPPMPPVENVPRVPDAPLPGMMLPAPRPVPADPVMRPPSTPPVLPPAPQAMQPALPMLPGPQLPAQPSQPPPQP